MSIKIYDFTVLDFSFTQIQSKQITHCIPIHSINLPNRSITYKITIYFCYSLNKNKYLRKH